ncbi:hypothetical protein ACFSTC_04510 [Nonomuraea ferruginea]
MVDWVAMDPYADHRVQDFGSLVNKTRADFDEWPGFYRWMQWRFPGKPVMIAEWGGVRAARRPGLQAGVLRVGAPPDPPLPADQGHGLLRLAARAAGRHQVRHRRDG